MNFYIYFTVALMTCFFSESKSHHHEENHPSHHKEHHGNHHGDNRKHHGSQSSSSSEETSEESSESNEVHKLGYLHSHLHEHEHEHEAKGRGLIADAFKKKLENSPMVQMFNKLANKGETATMAPITGPIENSTLFKQALDVTFFEVEAKRFKVCNGLPLHIPQRKVQAALTCQNETESYPCYKACIFEEIEITKYERLYETGMSSSVEALYKEQSDEVKRAFKKNYRDCFEDGLRLMVRGPKCPKNIKIVDCLIAGHYKICNTDSEGNDLLKKDGKDKSKTEKDDD